jgi:excinuclease ABC subunit C
MYRYAECEQYEAAAKCRDAADALGKLSERQKAVATPGTDRDAIGVYEDGACTVMCLLRVRDGVLNDKLLFNLEGDVIADASALISLLFEHYRVSLDIPDRILVGFDCTETELSALAELLGELHKRKVDISLPRIGDNKKLCELAAENAHQAALKYIRDNEKNDDAAIALAQMLALEVVPYRIEAYDISNIGNDNITAGMIVTEGGRFAKSEYRSFNIKSTAIQDDYASLREALVRRLSYLLPDSESANKSDEKRRSFEVTPDLILLDGGTGHLSVALDVMNELGIYIPVAGMVKDEYHKTRALVVYDGNEFCEVNIAKAREVYIFIYKIQEEVHRFSIGKMSRAKRKTVKTSSLTKIKGIGPAKAKALLDAFGGIGAIKSASTAALTAVSGINKNDAYRIRQYYSDKTPEDEE